MPTSFAIMEAVADKTVADRLVAVAASMSVSESQVRGALRELVCAPVEVEGDATLASVYEYAVTTPAVLTRKSALTFAFPVAPTKRGCFGLASTGSRHH